MELILGTVYQKHNFNLLKDGLDNALKKGHLDPSDYQCIQAALARLVSDQLPADHRISADISVIHQRLNRIKPAYLSSSGLFGMVRGAVSGMFVLCLAVALSPTLPLWLYYTIPSVVAMTNYLFFHHQTVANEIRSRITEFENGYLRRQLAAGLINQHQFCHEAIDAIKSSPYESLLLIPFLTLRNHLLQLYSRRELTVSGAIGIHQSMNALMRAMKEENIDQVYAHLREVERLIDESTPSAYHATDAFFSVGVVIGVCVIALSVFSAGTFTGFCATVYAVSLLAAQCALLGYLVDGINNVCRKSETLSKSQPLSASISGLFKPMREKETALFRKASAELASPEHPSSKTPESADDLFNASYLNLART